MRESETTRSRTTTTTTTTKGIRRSSSRSCRPATAAAAAATLSVVVVVLALLLTLVSLPSTRGFSAAPVPSTKNAATKKNAAARLPDPSDEDRVRDQLGYLPSNYVGVSAWKKKQPSSGDRRGVDPVVRVVNSTTTTMTTTTMVPVAIQTYPLNGGARRRQNKARLSEAETRKQRGRDDEPSSAAAAAIVQSPFPTLFWLTCPDISRAVADLERRGCVRVFEDAINSDPLLVRRLYGSHEEYAALRWRSLSDEDRAVLESAPTPSLRRMRTMMESSGISGTNVTDVVVVSSSSRLGDDDDAASERVVPPIKCLHAHYAHYRSTAFLETTRFVNPVGELIHRRLLRDFPDLDL